ncbi:cytochrome C oxidase subunit IV family protein [Brevibacillus massiliensis]|uniref:cytochrome C oxidase subunit IV family protein n=1 Tax=Brevibacillus massiliensis TaxID=1118054 RepID=UPI0002F30F75|nr:cytochrome C oxidase subunit IV family protein [Brevibacillus massiliensis]
MTDTHSGANRKEEKHVPSQHSSRNHLITFGLSIILTAIAFAAVAMEQVDVKSVVPFIFLLALIQAGFQLFVWMHLDQKGHQFQRIFMAAGAFVALLTIVTFVFWIWW